jgi:hypothetical protein
MEIIMKVQKSIFFAALIVTMFIFSSMVLVGNFFSEQREETIRMQMMEMQNSITEVQTFFLMSEVWGDEMACIAFREKIADLDKTIWDIGQRIDQYRIASEEFFRDPYYLQQKRIFNENQLVYLTLLTKLKQECGYEQSIISFFYKYEGDCARCDDQSFILTDINRELAEEVSIFSFDMDLEIRGIELLHDYYDIQELPCVVIDDEPYCGLQTKRFITDRMCEHNPNMTGCSASYTQ